MLTTVVSSADIKVPINRDKSIDVDFMGTDKTIRKPKQKPKQKRSINTKEKILEAVLKLFCEKGLLL